MIFLNKESLNPSLSPHLSHTQQIAQAVKFSNSPASAKETDNSQLNQQIKHLQELKSQLNILQQKSAMHQQRSQVSKKPVLAGALSNGQNSRREEAAMSSQSSLRHYNLLATSSGF